MAMLIICPGPRASGKSYAAAHIAAAAPKALVIEQHPYGLAEHDRLYAESQHTDDLWVRSRGKIVGMRSIGAELLIGRELIILCCYHHEIEPMVDLLRPHFTGSPVFATPFKPEPSDFMRKLLAEVTS